MKAALLEELEKIVVREVDDPQIDDDSALLKVESVAVCGSDIRIFHHGNPRVKPPGSDGVMGRGSPGTALLAQGAPGPYRVWPWGPPGQNDGPGWPGDAAQLAGDGGRTRLPGSHTGRAGRRRCRVTRATPVADRSGQAA